METATFFDAPSAKQNPTGSSLRGALIANSASLRVGLSANRLILLAVGFVQLMSLAPALRGGILLNPAERMMNADGL